MTAYMVVRRTDGHSVNVKYRRDQEFRVTLIAIHEKEGPVPDWSLLKNNRYTTKSTMKKDVLTLLRSVAELPPIWSPPTRYLFSIEAHKTLEELLEPYCTELENGDLSIRDKEGTTRTIRKGNWVYKPRMQLNKNKVYKNVSH